MVDSLPTIHRIYRTGFNDAILGDVRSSLRFTLGGLRPNEIDKELLFELLSIKILSKDYFERQDLKGLVDIRSFVLKDLTIL